MLLENILNALSPLKPVSLIDDFVGSCSDVIRCDTSQNCDVLISVNSYANQKGEKYYFCYLAFFVLIFMLIGVLEVLIHLDP